jgi:hypothetical protein
LLKDEGMTLDGARRRMSEKWTDTEYKYEINESLLKIKSLLNDLKETI